MSSDKIGKSERVVIVVKEMKAPREERSFSGKQKLKVGGSSTPVISVGDRSPGIITGARRNRSGRDSPKTLAEPRGKGNTLKGG